MSAILHLSSSGRTTVSKTVGGGSIPSRCVCLISLLFKHSFSKTYIRRLKRWTILDKRIVQERTSQPNGEKVRRSKAVVCLNAFLLWKNTQVWLKGTVLNTVRSVKRRVGSNPTSSLINVV